jgi:hypothetical protein
MAYLGLDGFCFAAGAEVLLDGMTIVDEPLDEALIRQVAAAFDSFGLNYNLEAGEGAGSASTIRPFMRSALLTW